MDIRDMTYEQVLVLAYTGREPEDPECRGFQWIGQPFTSCDNCGRPVWEHEGWKRPRPDAKSLFSLKEDFWYVEPFKPGEAEGFRERWEKT